MQTVVPSEMLQLVTFKLAGQRYAVDILKVQEINNLREITAIPNASHYLVGAINLRGKVISVISLHKKFNLKGEPSGEAAKIVIVDVRGVVMGLLVDAVSDVLRISKEIVELPPCVSSNMSTEFIMGIAKLADGLVILLDLNKLFGEDGH